MNRKRIGSENSLDCLSPGLRSVSVVEISCQAVLFDSDGVLVDSHRDGRHAWFQLATEFGFALDDELFASLAGIRTADSLARFIEPSRLAEAIARLEDHEVELAASTPRIHGARELVTSIPDDRWAIATSASRRLGLARWAGAGIPIPNVVVTAEDVTRGKPDPEPYLTAAKLLGIDIADCIVVEDSPGGGHAGLASGARVLAVGAQEWPEDPSWRVPDLTSVSCTVTEDDRLSIAIADD